jgi:hypothetical protein
MNKPQTSSTKTAGVLYGSATCAGMFCGRVKIKGGNMKSMNIILCAIALQLVIMGIWLAVIAGRMADLVEAIKDLKGKVD